MKALMDAMLMIRPHRCLAMTRAAAWPQRNAPVRFTASVRSQMSSETSRNAAGRLTPALLTRMSRRPKLPRVCSINRVTSAGRLTSAGTARAPSSSVAAARAPASASTSAMTTRAPSATNLRAMPKPIPFAPPVTTAVLPVSFMLSSSPDRPVPQWAPPRSALEPCEGYALDEVSLRREVDDQDRHGADHGAGHDQVPAGDHGPFEKCQPERQGELVGIRQVDDRREQVVPLKHEDENRQRGKRGTRQRQIDTPVDAEGAAAVDLGGVIELSRNGEEELTQQKCPEGSAEKPRDDQRVVRVHPAQGSHQDEHRNHGHLIGDHQRGQQHVEERGTPRKAQPGKRVRGERAADHAPNGSQPGHFQAVE